ncbi:YegJ family protein [Pedobacter gandavensis]|uniref:DUF2314 domain-containing protein n=1 Tax=Pedobacter gandavensis TaxID=2679963 RepID=A0ABR6ER80_9SPHI|nr:DUF2314 domain-containing protein [Pedobacter gandavensis]MBB2147771.1 DUF2314 domain-containing protein [Pedobacter gandavensis]
MGFLSQFFKKGRLEERKNEFSLGYIPKEDERMNWAIEKARLTLWYFEEHLKRPKPGQDYFSIKVMVKDQDRVEHLWLTAPDFDEEGNLYGRVGNEPIQVNNIKLGQQIGIGRSLISDWMIVEHGILLGGYTIRAVRDVLPDIEKELFDESIGIAIDAGADHFIPDFSTPEGAITALEDAYQNKDLLKVLSCMDFREEARVLLGLLELGENDEVAIREASEALEAAYIENLEENGMPNVVDLKRAFSKRDKITNDYWIITEILTFPNGNVIEQRLKTVKTDDGWKVVGVFRDNIAS